MTTNERTNDERKQIAMTILEQLGGSRFIAMTGASSFSYNENDLSFRVSPRMTGGIQLVRITLDPMDTYKMEFIKVRNLKVIVLAEVENVYGDMLRAVFTRETGLETNL